MRKWILIGGDKRQISVLENFRKRNILVSSWGIGKNDEATDWIREVETADVVVLPLPVTDDGVRIRCPLHPEIGMRFLSLIEHMKSGSIVLGGNIPTLWIEQAERSGVRIYDYFQSETLQMRNALPTVEAALFLAMQALPVTLDGCKTAVLGYGRIASLLSEKLVALGAEVTVYARKEKDLAHARLRHCVAVPICKNNGVSALHDLSEDCRIVFNTIPHLVVTESILRNWRRDCVLMELASFPGGFDTMSVKEFDFPFILASALPGKHFPETAGNILADTLVDLVDMLEKHE